MVVEVELTLLELTLRLLQVEQVEQVKILVHIFQEHQILVFTLAVVAAVEFVQDQHQQVVEQVELAVVAVVKELIDQQLRLELQTLEEVVVEQAVEPHKTQELVDQEL